MSESWSEKLNELSYEDLSEAEKRELVLEMEQDEGLRKRVVSDLRFESVLKETLRTTTSPTYQSELSDRWSEEKVKEAMLKAGIEPMVKKPQAETVRTVPPFALWIGMSLLAFIFLFVFQMGEVPEPKKTKSVNSIDLSFNGEEIKVENAKGELKGLKEELLSNDIISTSEKGYADFKIKDGAFIELSENSQVKHVKSDSHTELQLLSGIMNATVTSMVLNGQDLILRMPEFKVMGSGFKVRLHRVDNVKAVQVLEGRLEAFLFKSQTSVQMRAGESYKLISDSEFEQITKEKDPLDKDLVGWWSMDDGLGKTVHDFSGRGFEGSLAEHVKLAEGRRGKALMISDINRNNLQIAHSPELNIHPIRGITVMAWVKTTRSKIATILDKRAGKEESNEYAGYQLVLVHGELRFQMNDGVTYMMRSESGLVADGKWHHICVSVSRDKVQKGTFYLDGEKCGEFDCSNIGNTDTEAVLNIGGHVHKHDHAFVGHIDEVRIYNRGLTQDEIKRVMNKSD